MDYGLLDKDIIAYVDKSDFTSLFNINDRDNEDIKINLKKMGYGNIIGGIYCTLSLFGDWWQWWTKTSTSKVGEIVICKYHTGKQY